MKTHEFVIHHASDGIFTTTKADRSLYNKHKSGLRQAYGEILPFGMLRVTATESVFGLGISTRFAMQQF